MHAIDALVLAKLSASHALVGATALGVELGIEGGEVIASSERLEAAGVWSRHGIDWANALDFFESALKYLVPPRSPDRLERGIPTGSYVPPLDALFVSGETPWVWSYESGTVVGRVLEPIDPLVIAAVAGDHELHLVLACADCFRIGGARERSAAHQVLSALLKRNASLQRRKTA